MAAQSDRCVVWVIRESGPLGPVTPAELAALIAGGSVDPDEPTLGRGAEEPTPAGAVAAAAQAVEGKPGSGAHDASGIPAMPGVVGAADWIAPGESPTAPTAPAGGDVSDRRRRPGRRAAMAAVGLVAGLIVLAAVLAGQAMWGAAAERDLVGDWRVAVEDRPMTAGPPDAAPVAASFRVQLDGRVRFGATGEYLSSGTLSVSSDEADRPLLVDYTERGTWYRRGRTLRIHAFDVQVRVARSSAEAIGAGGTTMTVAQLRELGPRATEGWREQRIRSVLADEATIDAPAWFRALTGDPRATLPMVRRGE